MVQAREEPGAADLSKARALMLETACLLIVIDNQNGLRGGYGYGRYGYANPGWNGSPPMAGPPWAGPNQCWEDLGYGRYERCNW